MVAIKDNLDKITHEIRQQIIVELGEKVAMSYSDLMKNLNLTSAKLHFHLKKLSGLVEQNNEGKYTLTERGKEAYNFISGKVTTENTGATSVNKSKWAVAWPLIIVVGLLFLSFIISFLLPLVAPILGLALFIGGILTYQKSTDIAMRSVAVVAVAGGVLIILFVIWMGLGLLAVDRVTSASEVALQAPM
ncbi:hypothetical protein BMS3Bbin16_00584 [archaeon BMS3Bbin16]|nr:hypothetical protein BMS3Bbin16_00584 [archaeon BMS3Bbin16]